MNKKQRLQIQQAKKVAPITVQEAWNRIAEFMEEETGFSYFISPWNRGNDKKYTLQTIINEKMVYMLEANKEWKR